MSNNNQAGKGDKPRPVNKKQYNDNYDCINWHRPKKNVDTLKKSSKLSK